MRNIKDIYGDQEIQDLRWKVKQKIQDGKDWIVENRDTIVVLAPIVIGIAAPIIKSVSKHVTLRKTKDLKELYCYDRSLGHYWRLKRELSNQEWVTIDRRKKCGEHLADILESMKVLK